ncbi:hypothetical protein ABBQ38_005341 [Trebouxia sp. C0009 RCD-2024]
MAVGHNAVHQDMLHCHVMPEQNFTCHNTAVVDCPACMAAASAVADPVLQAATGAHSGEIVLWTPLALDAQGKKFRKAAKILSIHSSPVYSLTRVDRFLVSGAADGYVRFFDDRLRLVAWFEDLEAGPIKSVHFSQVAKTRLEGAHTPEEDYFSAPDFVVGSRTGSIVAVRSGSFEETSSDVPAHRLLLQGLANNITAFVTHPTKPRFVAAAAGGVVQTWDLLSHALVGALCLPTPTNITAMAFSHDGIILAMGGSMGVVRLCREADSELIADFRPVKQAITHMDFSSNSKQLALGFADASVALVALLSFKGGQTRWDVVGQQAAHPAPAALVGLAFGEAPSGVTKLFSLGDQDTDDEQEDGDETKDGSIAEYDVDKPSQARGLRLTSLHHLAGPTAMSPGPSPKALAFAPPLPYFTQGCSDTVLLVADEEYKLRLYNADSHLCVSTAVGPLHSGPINSCRVFRSISADTFYIAYSTAQQVVGVMAWPLNGDPAKSLGLIAHPGPVVGMNLSHDGCKLVTAGHNDGSVMVWQMDSNALESTIGGSAARRTPLQILVDIEGPDSTFQQDVSDYFCYAQLAQQGKQGVDASLQLLEGKLGVDQIMSLCQALGYFPTEQEVSQMLQELAYEAASRQQPAPTHVDLQQFLGLYLNHRPALQEPSDEVSQAFAALGADSATGRLSREELVQALTTCGEPLSQEEMASCMRALTGSEDILQVLPEDVTAGDFACGLLGFDNALDTEPLQISAGA